MEYALGTTSLCGYDAAPTLPSHPNDFSVLHKNRHGVRRGGQLPHARSRLRIGFHIKLPKILPRPFEPFAHLACVRATRCAVELQVRHLRISPLRHESCYKSLPER